MIDCLVTPSFPASRSKDSTILVGKSTFTRFAFDTSSKAVMAKSLTDAKRLGLDAQSLAGHSSAAMTEHYIKQRDFKRVKGLM